MQQNEERRAPWAVDKNAPCPILFMYVRQRSVPLEESSHLYTRVGEPKKLVVLHGYGDDNVYLEPAFREVMRAILEWFQTYLPAWGTVNSRSYTVR